MSNIVREMEEYADMLGRYRELIILLNTVKHYYLDKNKLRQLLSEEIITPIAVDDSKLLIYYELLK